MGDFVIIVLGLTAYTFAMGAFGAWGPTFLNRVHGMELGFADHFFGGVLVVGGLLGTLKSNPRLSRHVKPEQISAPGDWRKRSPGLVSGGWAFQFNNPCYPDLDIGLTASMIFLGAAIFLSFLPTGPQVTLQIESVPAHLRASAMAASIFVIHLFGDFLSPALVGHLADLGHDPNGPGAGLQHAMFILPAAMSLAVLFWGWLAWRQGARAAPAMAGGMMNRTT